MDLKQIQELIRMINKSNIGEVSIEEETGFKLVIKQKRDAAVVQQMAQPVAHVVASSAAMPVSTSANPVASDGAKATTTAAPVADNSNLVTIKSPMIGTFYRSAGPDKPSFVNIGDAVETGKVLCIIEAMKLFNEIECEIKGKIVKILVEDASPVEFDQPLFLVEPN